MPLVKLWRGEGLFVKPKQHTRQTINGLFAINNTSYSSLEFTAITGKMMISGEVLRQQHKEHDANRPQVLSYIGNFDLQESHTDNDDRCTQILW
jgi:hypothetical protein